MGSSSRGGHETENHFIMDTVNNNTVKLDFMNQLCIRKRPIYDTRCISVQYEKRACCKTHGPGNTMNACVCVRQCVPQTAAAQRQKLIKQKNLRARGVPWRARAIRSLGGTIAVARGGGRPKATGRRRNSCAYFIRSNAVLQRVRALQHRARRPPVAPPHRAPNGVPLTHP